MFLIGFSFFAWLRARLDLRLLFAFPLLLPFCALPPPLSLSRAFATRPKKTLKKTATTPGQGHGALRRRSRTRRLHLCPRRRSCRRRRCSGVERRRRQAPLLRSVVPSSVPSFSSCRSLLAEGSEALAPVVGGLLTGHPVFGGEGENVERKKRKKKKREKKKRKKRKQVALRDALSLSLSLFFDGFRFPLSF